MFIRSIRGLHPSKFLELCIIWIGIGVENNLSMSNFIACLENENIIKGLRPLSHSLRLRTVHAAIVCLGSSFRMIGFFKCSQTDKTITHACVCASVWCDMSWLMMNYSCYICIVLYIQPPCLGPSPRPHAPKRENLTGVGGKRG